MKTKNERETRSFKTKFEIEKRSSDGKKIIIGYAAKFNEMSEPIYGLFKEIIKPGAFKDALNDVRALINHRHDNVLGRQSSGTLKVYEDEVGLRYEITPPDTQAAKDLMISIERGDIKESSFCFDGVEDDWEEGDENSLPVRTITKFGEIFDISPVTFPAYKSTSVGVGTRSAKEVFEEYKKNIEKAEKNNFVDEQRNLERDIRLLEAEKI